MKRFYPDRKIGNHIWWLLPLLLILAAGCSEDKNDPYVPTIPLDLITVGISSPLEGAAFQEGVLINFTGAAVDSTLTVISGEDLVWTSSLDGQIGTGITFNYAPTVGSHTITLTATDWRDRTAQATVHITVAGEIPSDDLLGVWNYATSDGWSSGFPWPAPPAASGFLTLTANGPTVTLTFNTGFVCDPAWGCVFTGGVLANTYQGGNTGIVDIEGGTVTSTLMFTTTSQTTGLGSGGSVYQHPGGAQGSWGYTITLTRPVVGKVTNSQ